MEKKILIIDDDAAIRNAVRLPLVKRGYQVFEARDGAEGLVQIDEVDPDLILLDVDMPVMNGLDLCRRIRSDPKRILYIMMLTAHAEKEVEALEIGADDYVVKPFNKEKLLARIKRGLKVAEQRKEMNIDSLTGVFNRRTFNTFFAQEEERALRYNRPLSLIIADIDYFKMVNDTRGHNVGDMVLRDFADILRGNCRKSDLVARWGGEEFVVLLPETDLEGAAFLAEKNRQDVAGYSFPEIGRLTASFGVAKLATGHAGLIKRADDALYTAKRNGRNRVVIDKPDVEQDEIISVLIIDDDKAIRDLLTVKMMMFDYMVSVAENGEKAFDILQRRHIDLALIDQEMPGRDGMATFLAIKEQWPEMPVVMITSHSSKHLIKSFFTSGGRDFIEKPITDFESLDFRLRRVVREVRREKESEEKLRATRVREESQKVRDVLLASIGHEFRAPLVELTGFLGSARELLLAAKPPLKKVEGLLAEISGAADNLREMVDDIIKVTLLSEEVFLDIAFVKLKEVAQIVKGRIAPRAKKKKLALSFDVSARLPAVKADRQKLIEVLYKIMDNAVKFTESGSVVLSARQKDGEVVVSIDDTGGGIPEEQLENIFEHLSLDDSGEFQPEAGLGLYICKKMIELMGGRIWVEAKKEGGTTFFFSLATAA